MVAALDINSLKIARDALDADVGQRDSFVSMRCGADLALQVRVEALLDGIATAELEDADSASTDNLAVTETSAFDSMQGTRLGAFRIAERIGRGGMGIVYRGVREGADFDQQVAIKLIRRGYDFDDVHARFLRERRILARLAHPNLARFIDGGVAADGRPWFALEFVRGVSITCWCDEHTLGVRERVRLFLDVCAAVQHAHTQLVVHRDLKPGNVLVDDSGAVRLLDFGVAGLLAGDTDDGAMPTIGQRHALTPEYAAPEQLAGEGAGVAVDVYALGVTLYELIAGVLPYAIERSDLAATERAVRELPPHALAQAIFRTGPAPIASDAATRRLAMRGTNARAYRALARGDLSRIVDKALAKEPKRRYATVQAFADDLACWLGGIPVQVSGNPFGYRFGKFIRRNRVAVGLGTLLAVSVVTAIIGMAWQSHETRRQADAALLMKDHLVEMIAQFDSRETGTAAPTLLRLVEDSVAQLDSLQFGSPLRRELAADVARLLKRVGRPEQALRIVERELGTDPGHGARTDTARVRQTAAWAEALLYWDRPDEAWQYLAQATAHPGDAATLQLADALNIQAEVENATGRFALAVTSAQQALALFRQSLPDSDRHVAAARFALAAALVGIRDDEGGRAQSERVLVDLPPMDSNLRRFALTKAAMRRSLFGDFGSAEAAYANGDAMARRLDPTARHGFEVAMRAVNLFDLGELDRSLALMAPIRRANKTQGDPMGWETWSTDWLIGEIALVDQQPSEAATLFGHAAAAARQQGASFQDFALYNKSLEAVALALAGQLETSSGALETADAYVAKASSYATAMRAAARGVWLDRSGKFAAATRAFDAALEEMNKAHQSPIGLREQLMEHRDAVRIRYWRAQSLQNAGSSTLAQRALLEAQQLGSRTLGTAHPFMSVFEHSDARVGTAPAIEY